MEELNKTLKYEIKTLTTKNETLFKTNKNQKKLINKLKKIIEKQNGFLKNVKLNNIEDNDWEDLDLILKESDMNN